MKKTNLQSAFFNPRVLVAFALCLLGTLIALLGFGVFTSSSAQAQGRDAKAARSTEKQPQGIISVASSKNDVSPPLRDQPPWPVTAKGIEREANENPKIPHNHIDQPDPVIQNARASMLALLAPSIPAPIRNFDGIPYPGVACNCAPPDTNGEVGATQYVQSVNIGLQVFDKATGASLLGPVGIASLWAGFGGVCETNGNGDPIVLYDQLANRWLVSQFAGTSVPTTECIAISQTSDATGSWYRYAFTLGTNFFDYPHLGVWPDGYYMAMNVFNSAGTAFLGAQAFAFDRAKMLAGMPATFVTPGFLPNAANDETFLPADLDGSNPPPAGKPNPFLYWPGGASANTFRIMHFHADFATPANTTFTQFGAALSSAAFTELCPTTRSCVPQVGTTNRLDAIGDRLMHRLAYRNFGTHESLVGNFTVSANSVAGIRWFELRNVTNGPASVYQQSTYQPDTDWRWMGSAAMDGAGSLALGFSASSATITPQIRYAGRFASDPLNVLAQGETTAPITPTGSQTGTLNRWGDYSALSIDPVDDATFWYTTEYIPANGSFNWRTRIVSFKLPTTPTNNVIKGGSYIVSAGANGVMDPNEVVTVALGLKNAGGPGNPCTTSLTGTLQAGGGVTNPPAAQNYGVACAADAEKYMYYTFTVDPALICGNTISATLNVADGATPYGPFVYTFPTGSTVTSNVQNFDSVTAPALPAGWSGSASGSGVAGQTVTTFPDTAPNAVYLSEQSTVGLSEVTSAPVAITSGGSKLSFRNEFNTESTYDGLVLEISIAGGAFQDILTAGGSFASGGYNSTLSTGFANPLPGRMAWTGLSGGTAAAPTYITTVVNLPAAAVGQMVQFKWRQGSDNSVVPSTNPGSRIDSITLVSTVCGGNAPAVNSAVSRLTHGAAGTFDVPLPIVPINGAIGVEPRNGPSTMVVTFANPVTVGSTAVTAGTGTASASVSSNVVTVTLTGVTDAQRLGVTLTNVSDGTNVGNVIVPMGVLNGDTNGNGSVTSADVSQTKAQSGTPVTGSNFRSDVNVSGTLTSADISLVKSKSGAALPP